MIMDLVALDGILAEEIVAPLGGKHLNTVLPEVADGTTQPSCEVLAAWCFQRVARRLPSDVTVARVRVAEDATLWADCLGPA
jgi:6-pyruvoyl-tetrahydropterin synthase